MAQLILPRVQAMVLCDEVEESDRDGDIIDLSGVRAEIAAPLYPTIRAQLCVFMQMSGHAGKAKFHIEIESLNTDEVVHESEPLTFWFVDPTEIMPAYFRLTNCVFPVPGVYYVQVITSDKVIGERPLLLRKEE